MADKKKVTELLKQATKSNFKPIVETNYFSKKSQDKLFKKGK